MRLNKSIIFLLVFNNCGMSFGQTIDNSLESITIPIKKVDHRTTKKSKFIFPCSKDKIILTAQAVIQKEGQMFITDKLHHTTGILRYPDTCKYFSDGTKALLIGAALSDKIDKGKIIKCASFRIENMPNIGDTAKFEFYLLTLKRQELSPQVFYSEKLLTGRKQQILNKKSFVFSERLTPGSQNERDLVLASTKFLVTKKTSKYNWIHIVTDSERNDKGLIVARNVILDTSSVLKENLISEKKSEKYFEIYFDYDSFDLKEQDTLAMDSLITRIKEFPHVMIQVQGFSDNKGKPEYNLILAQKRAEIVIDYLIKHGVLEAKIVRKTPQIGSLFDDVLNRSCRLMLVEKK